jgi:hypothetical protein
MVRYILLTKFAKHSRLRSNSFGAQAPRTGVIKLSVPNYDEHLGQTGTLNPFVLSSPRGGEYRSMNSLMIKFYIN